MLSIRDLYVSYASRGRRVQAVRGVNLDVHRGESVALIGESGSGKTTLALALVRLLPRAARITGGTVHYTRGSTETDVLALSTEALRRYRWEDCAMVFQAALNAFNPVLQIVDQMVDTYQAHRRQRRSAIIERSSELLRMVQLEPSRVLNSYPHELSGGMRQRVLIAMSLLLEPQVLILDEPTTALDILTQRAIIDLLRDLREKLTFAMVFVSHDLSLAAELADRVATMYAGRIVEECDVRQMFYRPAHPYTAGLLDAVPVVTGDTIALSAIPGSPPDLIDLPSGCAFQPRCSFATDRCLADDPQPISVDTGHTAACFHWQALRKSREMAHAR